MKKGFTLIELLAVIVILAIIALIATPIILGILGDSREEAKQRTAELIGHGVELAYTSYLFENSGIGTSDDFCYYMTSDYFEMENANIDNSNGSEVCSSDNTKVTVKSDDSEIYTVTYLNGIVTVEGAKEVVEVIMSSVKSLSIGFGARSCMENDVFTCKEVFVTSSPIGYDVSAQLYLSINDGEYQLITTKDTMSGMGGTLFSIDTENLSSSDTYKIKVVIPSSNLESNVLTLTTTNLDQSDIY